MYIPNVGLVIIRFLRVSRLVIFLSEGSGALDVVGLLVEV